MSAGTAIEVTYRDAIGRALADAMTADEDVFLLGEDIGAAGGAFKLTDGLFERFGPERVRDTPISEQAIIGAAIGAAVMGLKPVAEIMFADFAGVCFDGIANEMAKYRYMTGGQVTVPVTVRLGNGAGAGFAAQHSQTCENWFLGVAGLKIAVPATPADMYGLLRGAIEDPDPVLVFEHKHLFNAKGELAGDAAAAPLGRASVVRSGDDVTLVATQLMRHRAEEAAELLAAEGYSVELIDPRTLVPLDADTITASVGRTRRVVVAQEAAIAGSWGASLVAELVHEHFEWLDAPPAIVATEDTPVPYSAPLESDWLPSTERIAEAVRATCEF
jgi:acetoin:2,6-dichlorophenolindophenol oxidoreductase subunit beta